MTRIAVMIALACAACGADDPLARDTAPAATPGEAIERETRSGPVTATVTVVPAKPKLGDTLSLVLAVTAEPGVDVVMPPFGDALGRFEVVHYIPRARQHEYRLRATRSGKLRIPPLRIEYVDGRTGATAEPQELLTDEIPLDIESVLPEGSVTDKLSAPRDKLPVPAGPRPWLLIGAIALAIIAVGVGAWVLVRLRRRARERAVLIAYRRALAALQVLADQGPPASEQADRWYVELSGVVRHYLEGRYDIRAPELTTEEFLAQVRTFVALAAEHRTMLSAFLAACDRVKFAGYQPPADESTGMLDEALAFVRATRPHDQEAA